MTNAEFLTSAKQYLEQIEDIYFTGCFSESVIETDLENRKASDRYSTMGSNPRQTNLLWEKKQYYFQDFDEKEQSFNFIISKLRSITLNHEWIPRVERCKNQIVKLRNLVRDF